MIKKIGVLAVFIFTYASVVPLKAAKNEIVDARIAAETDAQAAASDANSAMNQLYYMGGITCVTISVIGGASLGCWLGEALDPGPCMTTGMGWGCLAGWGLGFAGSVYGIYELGGRVPSERLLGKSPEYIEVYTAAYKREVRLQRAIRAAAGSVWLHGMFLVWARYNLLGSSDPD